MIQVLHGCFERHFCKLSFLSFVNFHEEKAQPPICTDTNQALGSHVSIAAGLTRPSTATGQRAPCAPRRPQSCPLPRAPLHPASSSHMSPHVVGVTGASPRRTASADRRPASRGARAAGSRPCPSPRRPHPTRSWPVPREAALQHSRGSRTPNAPGARLCAPPRRWAWPPGSRDLHRGIPHFSPPFH